MKIKQKNYFVSIHSHRNDFGLQIKELIAEHSLSLPQTRPPSFLAAQKPALFQLLYDLKKIFKEFCF